LAARCALASVGRNEILRGTTAFDPERSFTASTW
jgi:hypothetical protein